MIDPDLTGKSALVTGSARGVGKELLLAMAKRGASVAVHYHTSEEAASDVAKRAREASGNDAATVTVVQGDVTDSEAVEELFDAAEDALGTIDVLVNNVGDFAPTHWEDIDFETWNRVWETNFNGTYLCSKRVLPGMRAQEYGRIVNLGYASSDRHLVAPTNFPYFAAKTGVLMFTRMLAADTQEEGITANTISPYVVENSEVMPEDLPRGRPASFEDMVQAMLFFLDEGSDYLSGQNVAVDGGWRPERI
ncbi:oxidoreductase [Halobacteriales archaeon QS_3_64_16]|nr:MAG: oxidoreductase [Halobacteriales archaeon QS_3_64_16]